MDEFLITAVLIMIVNGIFDAVVVAQLAGNKAKNKTQAFLDSPEADPYYQRMGEQAAAKIKPMISAEISEIKTDLTEEMTDLIQTELSKIKIPTANELSANMTAEIQKNLSLQSQEILNIQQSTIEAVNAQLNALVEVMRDQMITTLDAKLKSWEAQKTRQLGKALEPYGVLIDESGNKIQAEFADQAAEGLSPLQVAALDFINQRTSPQFAEDNPGAAIFFKAAKLQAAKMFQDESAKRGGKSLNDSNKNTITKTSGIFG